MGKARSRRGSGTEKCLIKRVNSHCRRVSTVASLATGSAATRISEYAATPSTETPGSGCRSTNNTTDHTAAASVASIATDAHWLLSGVAAVFRGPTGRRAPASPTPKGHQCHQSLSPAPGAAGIQLVPTLARHHGFPPQTQTATGRARRLWLRFALGSAWWPSSHLPLSDPIRRCGSGQRVDSFASV